MAEVGDRLEECLPGEHAVPLQPLPQRRNLPHGGDGEFVEGHELFGIKRMGHEGE